MNIQFSGYASHKKYEDILDPDIKIITTKKVLLPLALESIPAGFPSPADDYVEKLVDLNEFLIYNPEATFMNRIRSRSMLNAGLDIDNIILVDRSMQPRHRSIVTALIDNRDRTVKRLIITACMSHEERVEVFGQDYNLKSLPNIWLKAENPEFENIFPVDQQTIQIDAVVTWNLSNMTML